MQTIKINVLTILIVLGTQFNVKSQVYETRLPDLGITCMFTNNFDVYQYCENCKKETKFGLIPTHDSLVSKDFEIIRFKSISRNKTLDSTIIVISDYSKLTSEIDSHPQLWIQIDKAVHVYKNGFFEANRNAYVFEVPKELLKELNNANYFYFNLTPSDFIYTPGKEDFIYNYIYGNNGWTEDFIK